MKKAVKRILIITLVLFVVLGAYVFYVFHTYYRLPDNLTLEVSRNGENTYFDEDFGLREGGDYLILTYNIGFGAFLWTEGSPLGRRMRKASLQGFPPWQRS